MAILCCPRPRSSYWRRELPHRKNNARGTVSISFATAGGGDRDSSTEHCLFVRRSIALGEIVEHSGTVVVFGNVDRGGVVRADGNVIVLGNLSGLCCAGQNGKTESVVFSLGRAFSSRVEISNSPEVSVRKVGDKNAAELAFLAMPTSRVENQSHRFYTSLARKRSAATRAAFFTGIYISIAGICFFLFPETLFGILFKLEYVSRGWIQATGILAVVFGIYYIGAALGDVFGFHGSSAFYLSTVVGRIFLFFSFLWLVICGACPPPLLIVGAVNLAGAVFMLAALKAASMSARQ